MTLADVVIPSQDLGRHVDSEQNHFCKKKKHVNSDDQTRSDSTRTPYNGVTLLSTALFIFTIGLPLTSSKYLILYTNEMTGNFCIMVRIQVAPCSIPLKVEELEEGTRRKGNFRAESDVCPI